MESRIELDGAKSNFKGFTPGTRKGKSRTSSRPPARKLRQIIPVLWPPTNLKGVPTLRGVRQRVAAAGMNAFVFALAAISSATDPPKRLGSSFNPCIGRSLATIDKYVPLTNVKFTIHLKSHPKTVRVRLTLASGLAFNVELTKDAHAVWEPHSITSNRKLGRGDRPVERAIFSVRNALVKPGGLYSLGFDACTVIVRPTKGSQVELFAKYPPYQPWSASYIRISASGDVVDWYQGY